MASTAVSKVTTLGSEGGDITPPHQTPKTDATVETEGPHDVDLSMVNLSLAPIQEDLNEAAENAALPEAPINTPEAFSPAPSVTARHNRRSRGFSVGCSLIHDRLAHVRDLDEASETQSLGYDDNESGGIPVTSPVGSIYVSLGSPAANPRFNEYSTYLSQYRSPGFNSMDQTVIATPTQAAFPQAALNTGHDHRYEGVHEKSIWAEEVMADIERALMRLEQLAEDEADVAKGSKSAKDFYVERLQKALNGEDRKYQVKVLNPSIGD